MTTTVTATEFTATTDSTVIFFVFNFSVVNLSGINFSDFSSSIFRLWDVNFSVFKSFEGTEDTDGDKLRAGVGTGTGLGAGLGVGVGTVVGEISIGIVKDEVGDRLTA